MDRVDGPYRPSSLFKRDWREENFTDNIRAGTGKFSQLAVTLTSDDKSYPRVFLKDPIMRPLKTLEFVP